jgi:hypothetical protein
MAANAPEHIFLKRKVKMKLEEFLEAVKKGKKYKFVIGTSGTHIASRLGDIYGLLNPCGTFKKGNINPAKTYKRKNGYLSIGLRINGIRKTELVHRLVFESFFGKTPKNTVIHHKNSNRADNRISNLDCISFSENNKKTKRKRTKHQLLLSSLSNQSHVIEEHSLPRITCDEKDSKNE